MTISLLFIIGFLYILGSVFFYINARRISFLKRLKRSYRVDYNIMPDAADRKTKNRPLKQHSPAARFLRWLKKNDIETDPGMLLINGLLFISVIFVACLFIRGGIFIFFSVSAISALIFYIVIDFRGRKINSKKEAQMEAFLIDLNGYLYANPNILLCIQKAVEHTDEPLKKDFMAVIEDTRKGMRINEALERLIAKSKSKTIQIIITGLIAANAKGVNLVDFLKDQIDYLREKKSIENYIRILSSGPRYTSYIIAVIPFLSIIAATFLNKDFAPALIHGVGPWILLYSCISYLAGFMLINRIINFSDKAGGPID
ncbi:MAG: type II secretion system F family protein [Actinobacteria bacterium]|nr:type II secretion system F family protein [Actinomycetota bacterium]